MFKKLVKYGNSQALLLNRSVLELLGINEGDSVKLRIEGEVLLVTKGQAGQYDEVMMKRDNAKEEEMQEKNISVEREAQRFIELVEKDTKGKKVDQSWLSKVLPSFPSLNSSMKKFEEASMKHFNKSYNELMKSVMDNADYRKEFDALYAKAKKEKMNKRDVGNAVLALRYKYFPELKAFDEEISS